MLSSLKRTKQCVSSLEGDFPNLCGDASLPIVSQIHLGKLLGIIIRRPIASSICSIECEEAFHISSKLVELIAEYSVFHLPRQLVEFVFHSLQIHAACSRLCFSWFWHLHHRRHRLSKTRQVQISSVLLHQQNHQSRRREEALYQQAHTQKKLDLDLQ